MIPLSIKAVIERYSDSASAYIVIDSSNIQVYKQLYRAAKAKQKLKFRVTTKDETKEINNATVPKVARLVTVEDVPEGAAEPEPVPETCPQPTTVKVEDPLITLSGEDAPAHSVSTSQESTSSEMPSALLTKVAQEQLLMEQNMEKLEAAFARTLKLADTLTIPTSCPAMSTSTPAGRVPAPWAPTPFAVCCNSCDKTIPDVHFHCSTCDDGDFDLCQACVDRNITCYGEDHWLIKRVIRNNTIINSTTETIAPKLKAKPQLPVPIVMPCTWARPSERPISVTTTNSTLREPWTIPISALDEDYRTCNSCVQGVLPHLSPHAKMDFCKLTPPSQISPRRNSCTA
jgi:next-to-BRCA1 protein 1